MDIDGLAVVVENNHRESLRHFEHIKKMYADQTARCDQRLCSLENMQITHDERIDEVEKDSARVKAVGGTIGVIWGGIVSLISIFK